MAVPRPISSRMTRLRSVAWLRMAAVSTISTMKVERPAARSSPAPTRLNRRSTMPICAVFRRHEGAHLRQDGDQRVLAQEGRFAGHVGTGDQPQPARCLRRTRSQSLGTKGCACWPSQAPLPPPDGGRASMWKARLSSIFGRAHNARRRQVRPALPPHRAPPAHRRCAVSASPCSSASCAHLVEQFALQRQRLFGGFARCGWPASPVRRSKSAPRLPMVWRWRKRSRLPSAISLSACCGVDLDEIAQHAIVLDLELGNAAVAGGTRLPARR